MGALLFLFVIATASLLVVRVGSTALMMTGLSWDAASFQAYSAFFGVGFTTREAELVVRHPVRRRIIRDLIFAGNVGLTSALATLIVTFVQTTGTRQTLTTMGIILGGLVLLLIISRLGFVTRALDFLIRRSLERVGVVRPRDYDLLLHVQSGYCVSEVDITVDSWLANQALKESRPADRGLIVLGIARRDGSFLGVPGADDRVEPGDVVTVYGKGSVIRSVDRKDEEESMEKSLEMDAVEVLPPRD